MIAIKDTVLAYCKSIVISMVSTYGLEKKAASEANTHDGRYKQGGQRASPINWNNKGDY
jgi:hypothetical protein